MARVRVKQGWDQAGREGELLAGPVKDRYGMNWMVVEWDDEDDPDCQKASSLESIDR